MNRLLNIAIMILFGFTMMPTVSHACNINHSDIQQSTVTPTTKSHSCCDENSVHEKDCCSDDCNNSSCCASATNSIIIPFYTEYTYISFFQEKNEISPLNQPVSSGFRTIWLPPKIVFSLSV